MSLPFKYVNIKIKDKIKTILVSSLDKNLNECFEKVAKITENNQFYHLRFSTNDDGRADLYIRKNKIYVLNIRGKFVLLDKIEGIENKRKYFEIHYWWQW